MTLTKLSAKNRKRNSNEPSLKIDGLPCFEENPKEDAGRNTEELVTSPAMSALRVVCAVEGSFANDHLDLPILIDVLRAHGKTVKNGDLSRAEAMLMGQATALQSLFARLTERAMSNGEIASFEANLKMALRAQSQCRSTLEALSAIKNPPVVYAKQANVTSGPQQINNTISMAAQAREIENAPNQLSGTTTNELYTHTRTSTIAGGNDQKMEAVGEINRTKDQRRKKQVSNARLQRG